MEKDIDCRPLSPNETMTLLSVSRDYQSHYSTRSNLSVTHLGAQNPDLTFVQLFTLF